MPYLYTPENGPVSGPPGPLTRGYRPTAPPISMGDIGLLLKSPLFLGALGLAAFVLWQSGKKKPMRRNADWDDVREGVARSTKAARYKARRRIHKYVVSWPEGRRTRRRSFSGKKGGASARTFARNRKGSKLFIKRGSQPWKRTAKY